MTLSTYPITVERQGRQYYAYSQDFPGAYVLGKTIDEAKKSPLKAMRLYIAHCRKTRKQVPAPRKVYTETVTIAVE